MFTPPLAPTVSGKVELSEEPEISAIIAAVDHVVQRSRVFKLQSACHTSPRRNFISLSTEN
jgi:hypothetical protein